MTDNNYKAVRYFPIMGNATMFIVPFYYGEENEEQQMPKGKANFLVSEDDDSLWEKETQMLTDEKEGSVLYPYIMSFLQGQMMDEDICKDGHLDIYSIADIDRRLVKEEKYEQRSIIKKFWNKFVQSEHVIDVGTKDKPHLLKFKFNNGKHKTLKPHLFVFSSARIGLLTFGVELTTPEATTNDLKLLNYYLHKIAKPIIKCIAAGLCVTDGVDAELRERQLITFQSARAYLEEHKEKNKKSTSVDNSIEFSWNMKTLIDLMLKDVRGIVCGSKESDVTRTPVELFTPPRIHVFTCCGIDDTKDLYNPDYILAELYQLSRCVNDKYLLPNEESSREEYLQTFDNVYVSSTIEGTAFITLAKEQNKGFFESFTSIFALRYVWIYLLAMVQRYSLLNMDRMLTVLDANDIKNKSIEKKNANNRTNANVEIEKHNNMLWRLLESIRNVKVRCHFTDISPFTQHNAFYEHCCDKLHVTRAYDEIDHKTKALNMTINHDLQLIQTDRERRLNLFLGILAALQALGVVYELISSLIIKKNITTFYLYLALILTAFFVVYFFYRKHN
jgi:hypothetical protein